MVHPFVHSRVVWLGPDAGMGGQKVRKDVVGKEIAEGMDVPAGSVAVKEENDGLSSLSLSFR